MLTPAGRGGREPTQRANGPHRGLRSGTCLLAEQTAAVGFDSFLSTFVSWFVDTFAGGFDGHFWRSYLSWSGRQRFDRHFVSCLQSIVLLSITCGSS